MRKWVPKNGTQRARGYKKASSCKRPAQYWRSLHGPSPTFARSTPNGQNTAESNTAVYQAPDGGPTSESQDNCVRASKRIKACEPMVMLMGARAYSTNEKFGRRRLAYGIHISPEYSSTSRRDPGRPILCRRTIFLRASAEAKTR